MLKLFVWRHGTISSLSWSRMGSIRQYKGRQTDRQTDGRTDEQSEGRTDWRTQTHGHRQTRSVASDLGPYCLGPGSFANFPFRPRVVSPTFPFAPSRFTPPPPPESFGPLSRSLPSRFAPFINVCGCILPLFFSMDNNVNIHHLVQKLYIQNSSNFSHFKRPS